MSILSTEPAPQEDIMYSSLADEVARSHREALLAEAASARLAKLAQGRRARHSSRRARTVSHPIVAFQSWFTSGQL